MSTPEHQARAALMRAADAGDPVMGNLVSQAGAAQALQTIRERAAPPGCADELAPRLQIWHDRLSAADPAADIEAGERAGARLVIPGDAEWPTQLDALGPGRPLGLWLHGTADLRFSCLRSVAVVGARAATSYGVHVAAQFGIGLCEKGWTVVSGGAFGIDGAAHRGALAAGGPTVVVLACGVDYCYPSEHRSLFAGARDHGVLVSECPPGVRPTRGRFLIRNRLIAALSRGTLVVEAALRSGALNTAGHALTLDRHLGAVPGPITSTLSDGCHHLLRERKAVCITTPEEMIELVGALGDDLAPAPRAPALPRDSLPEQTRRVLDAVPSRISAGPATIAVAAGVDLNAALSALGSLAAAGYVERTAAGWRARSPASPVYPRAEPASLPISKRPDPSPSAPRPSATASTDPVRSPPNPSASTRAAAPGTGQPFQRASGMGDEVRAQCEVVSDGVLAGAGRLVGSASGVGDEARDQCEVVSDGVLAGAGRLVGSASGGDEALALSEAASQGAAAAMTPTSPAAPPPGPAEGHESSTAVPRPRSASE